MPHWQLTLPQRSSWGFLEGVPSQCELIFTETSAALSLSRRTRHPLRSAALTQTYRHNQTLLRVCQLFTDNRLVLSQSIKGSLVRVMTRTLVVESDSR